MHRMAWRGVAVCALLSAQIGVGAASAQAQVVIGGSAHPDVEVNTGVLERLGQQPSLPDMLLGNVPGPALQASPGQSPTTGKAPLTFHPYKPQGPSGSAASSQRKTAAPKPAKATAHASSAKVVPASTPTTAAASKTAASAVPAGPEISLPEVDAPAKSTPSAATAKPAEPTKIAAPAPASAKTVETVAVPEPMKAPELPKASEPVKPSEPDKVAAYTQPQAAETPKAGETPKPVKGAEAPQTPKAAEPQDQQPAAARSTPQPFVPPPPVVPKTAPGSSEPAPAPQTRTAAVAVPPAPTNLAASSKADTIQNGDTLSVIFAADSARLPDGARAPLDHLAQRMGRDDGLGLQLLAYAEGDDSGVSKARRLSLSRALEVRKFLMEQGVRSTRIEVRALGNKGDGGGPADRVDAVLVGR